MNCRRRTFQRHAAVSRRARIYRHKALLYMIAAVAGAAQPAEAAGGHHAVDDATLLEPGQCQLETWLDRESGDARSLLHTGLACRIGAVELGLNLDHVRPSGAGATTGLSMQAKWARALDDRWSAGVVLVLAAQDRAPSYLGSTFVVPVTWQASETLLAHLNLSQDFLPGQRDRRHADFALEWSPLDTASFVAERYSEGGADFWRVGGRWAMTSSTNLDLSRARGLHGNTGVRWTLGLTWVFDR